MPDYTVRVQLHAAEPIDYTELHEEMASIGLKREILSDNGFWYELPQAEYHGVNLNVALEPLREIVRDIIARTNPAGGYVLVSQVIASAWYLPKTR